MKLFARTYGTTGDPLVILHGLFGSSINWQTPARRFAEPFRVFALDLRNHGDSPHADAISYPLMADDVRAFMDAHDLRRAHLIGHSMGGKVAMELALKHPDRVDRLVVADIAPRPYPPRQLELLEALVDLDLDALASRREAERLLRARIPVRRVRQFLLKNLVRERGRYAWKINLPALETHLDVIMGSPESDELFERPALFVRGGASDYVLDTDLETIRAFFPEAELHTIEGAGHWIHADAPDAFADVVLKFLDPYAWAEEAWERVRDPFSA